MPVRIEYLQDGAGIQFTATGIVTGSEVIEANQKIYTRENLLRLRYKIIDRTGCTEYRVRQDDVRIIAAQDREAALVNPRIAMLLISTTPLQYGMSRMWQMHTEGSGFRTEIFGKREDALAWLKAHLGESADGAGPDAAV